MQQAHSPKFLRQRKFLLAAPLLVLPFLTLFFWAVGGGKEAKAPAAAVRQKGINLSLPNAHFKDDKGVDKMAYYNLAAADSSKAIEKRKGLSVFDGGSGDIDSGHIAGLRPTPAGAGHVYTDPNEERLHRKLDELSAVLNNTADHASVPQPPQKQQQEPAISSGEIDRLERMMHTMQTGSDSDQDMKDINGVLDKLLRLQHPDTRKDSSHTSPKGPVLAVSAVHSTVSSLLGFGDSVTPVAARNVFHGQYGHGSLAPLGNAVRATIPEPETLVTGATVKLELLDGVVISGTTLPAGSFVYGTASLSNERLLITVHSVRSGNSIFPVNMEAFDEDGLAGLYMPGAITRDVVKQSADESLNSIGMASLDPSLGAQATTAGIQMAKTLFSKKIRLVRVTVQAGYQLWLKNTAQH